MDWSLAAVPLRIRHPERRVIFPEPLHRQLLSCPDWGIGIPPSVKDLIPYASGIFVFIQFFLIRCASIWSTASRQDDPSSVHMEIPAKTILGHLMKKIFPVSPSPYLMIPFFLLICLKNPSFSLSTSSASLIMKWIDAMGLSPSCR